MNEGKRIELIKRLSKKLDDLILKRLQELGHSVNDSNFKEFITKKCHIEKTANSKIILYVDNKEVANWTHKIKTETNENGDVSVTYNIE